MSELELFIKTIRNGIKNGELKINKPISDYDLMIQFAVGKIGERKGYPCSVTIDEILNECMSMGEYAQKLLKED